MVRSAAPLRGPLCALALAVAACGPVRVADPVKTLSNPGALPSQHEAALLQLDQAPPKDYDKTLRRILFAPGFVQAVREQAFDRLQKRDLAELKEALKLSLPKLDALAWREWLCDRIAKEGWTDLTPTLVRAWSVPFPGWKDRDEDRPERRALVALHGEGRLTDVVADLLVNADPIKEQNLRLRCWELLQRHGQRDRLVALLSDTSVKPDDVLLSSLRRCAKELGTLPTTREEILWLQALLQTSQAAFWAEACAAVSKLPADTRAGLEIRELPVAVAAARFRPELLSLDNAELYRRVEARRSAKGSRIVSASLEGYRSGHTETLYAQRDTLRWGDLAAMVLAMDIVDDPAIRAALFDLGDRDLQDLSTEYGGVITVERDGKPKLTEFKPRVVGNDLRFEAPQAMFDLGYTGLFHFHMHAQEYENSRYAGPHEGDFGYADSTRANCLVFTFVRKRELNVDYYRHGPVVIDLGGLARPGTEG